MISVEEGDDAYFQWWRGRLSLEELRRVLGESLPPSQRFLKRVLSMIAADLEWMA